MIVINRNVTEHRATSIAVFKPFRSTVFSLCTVLLAAVILAELKAKLITERAAGCSTTGRTEGEAYNGTCRWLQYDWQN